MTESAGREGAPVRLQKVLAQAGVASRRASEDLIARGRVEVDGRVVREMGVKVDPATAVIRVEDRKSTRLNSSHVAISYAVFCLKKKKKERRENDGYEHTTGVE